MDNVREQILKVAIRKYGPGAQRDKAIEELSELIRALARCDDSENVAEEMADVRIMLDQLEIIFGNGQKVARYEVMKLRRLDARVHAADVIEEEARTDGGEAKKHLVDGEWITVKEIAERLGVEAQQIYNQIYYRKVSLQVAVNLYRENQILHDQGAAARYMVDGKWMTIRQAAEALGVTRGAVYQYMYKYQCSLADAMAAYREGRVRKKGGNRTVYHRVGRGTMTTAEAAARLGISVGAVRIYMYKHKASLAATIRHYEQRKKQRAEKEILGILGF